MPRQKRQIRIDGSVAYVPLSCDKEVIIDSADAALVGQYNWRLCNGYVMTWKPLGNGKRRTIYLHRLIMGEPDGLDVDHILHNKLDNRKSQLRLATHSQNLWNQGTRVNNTSGFKGVFWSKWANKWCARIHRYKKQTHLGYFPTAEEAAQAYREAALKYHGEFARTA